MHKLRREFVEITPREAAKLAKGRDGIDFARWLRRTLVEGDLVHGFLMSSSSPKALHEFFGIVFDEDCAFKAISTTGEWLVLTTIAYINGERVLNNPYIKWTRIDQASYEATMRISGFYERTREITDGR